MKRKNYNFKKADFTALNELLKCIPWNCAFLEEDVDICTERVNDLLLAAADMCIPTFTVKKKTNPPWITKEVLNKIKKEKKVMEKTKGSSISRKIVRSRRLNRKWLPIEGGHAILPAKKAAQNIFLTTKKSFRSLMISSQCSFT